MLFKIVCNDEIHRLKQNIQSFKELVEIIRTRFEGKIPANFCLEYQDSDSDRVRVNCEDDFAILLEESKEVKTVKIYVIEDLNSTLQTLPSKIEKVDSFEDISDEVLEIIEPKVVENVVTPNVEENVVTPEENSVLQKIENSVLKSVTQVNTDQLMDIFNVPQLHNKEVMRWVATKQTNDVEELVNLYMNEMINKFPVIVEDPLEEEVEIKEEPEVVVEEVVLEQTKLIEEVVKEPLKVEEVVIKEPVQVQSIQIKDFEEAPIKEVVENKVIEQEIVEEEFVEEKVEEEVVEEKVEEEVVEEKVEDKVEQPRLDYTDEEWKVWKQNNKWSKNQWKEWKNQWTKEEWLEWKKKKCHWKGKWGKCKGNWWQKKKEWFNKKFENKFDESIRKAIPQIAVQVAQILRKDVKTENKEFAPLKDQKVLENQHKAVHKNFICDGCGMSPIVGVCYTSSVQKDFDFCEKCEATIPHPYAFLKIKTPEQRPHAIFTVINEDEKKPFVPGKSPQPNLGQMFQKGMELFKGFCKDDKKENKMPCQFMKNMKKMMPCQMMKNMFKNCGTQKNKNFMKDIFCQWKKNCKKTQETKVEEPKVEDKEPKVENKVIDKIVETPKEPVVEKEQPKKEQLNQTAVAHAASLMDIFAVDEKMKDTIYKWVVAKNCDDIQKLVNLFLDEMQGKF